MTNNFCALMDKHLNDWYSAQVNLTRHLNEYGYPNVTDKHDKEFLKLLGGAVAHFHEFNNAVLQALGSVHESEVVSRFVRFHSNLVVSRVKNHFFREVPRFHQNDNFVAPEMNLLRTMRLIVSTFKEKSPSIESLSDHIGRQMFLMGILYEFVYGAERKGVFLKFEYNHETFKDKRAQFLNGFVGENDNSFYSLRRNTRTLQANLLTSYYEENVVSVKETRASYRDLIHDYIENPRGIEPCSWHISTILWKISSLVQDADLSINSHDTRQADFMKRLSKFIQNLSEIFEDGYNDDYLNYRDLVKCESNFIETLYTNESDESDVKQPIYVFRNMTSINKSFDKLNKKTRALFQGGDNLVSEIEYTPIDKLSWIINTKFRDVGCDFFRLETAIEHLDYNQLSSLLWAYEKSLPKKKAVGMYSAGVVMSHIVNAFRMIEKGSDYQDSISWAFQMFPYLSTHPLHDDKEPSLEPLVVLDDTYKTGFVHNGYESYLNRNMPGIKPVDIHVLVQDFRYEPINEKNKDQVSSILAREGNVFIATKEAEAMPEVNCPDIADYLGQKLENVTSSSLLDIVLDEEILFQDKPGSHLLVPSMYVCNSVFSLSISYLWANEIEAAADGKKVILTSPTYRGRVLALLTAFFLKKKNVNIIINESKISELLKLPNWRDQYFFQPIDSIVESGYCLNAKYASLWENNEILENHAPPAGVEIPKCLYDRNTH